MTQAEQPELIPLRALNQVSYCPRLYYLEYVESVMPINEYVEDGLFQHRRVNDPALANRARREGDVVRTRSVSLSSERLGITGKLKLTLQSSDAPQGGGTEGIRCFEHDERLFTLGKHALEIAGRELDRVAGRDQPFDRGIR